MFRRFKRVFHGWLLPETSRLGYLDLGKGRQAAFVGGTGVLHHKHHNISGNKKSNTDERFVYVGCLHGGNEDVFERLKQIKKHPPDYLIFAGDLTGSPQLEESKQLYYEVAGIAKIALTVHPHMSDGKLLSFLLSPSILKRSSGEFLTLKDGYLRLMKYHSNLGSKPPEELSNKEIANEIRRMTEYEYYGDWTRHLSKQTREAILSTFSISAERLANIIVSLRKKIKKVVFVEGNWDNAMLLAESEFSRGIDNLFNPKKFFSCFGIKQLEDISTLETKTTLHIFLPYISLLHFDFIPKRRLTRIKRQAKEARIRGKAVILVGHAEANWRVHHLWLRDIEAKGPRGKVIRNFGKAMTIFEPQEVIYPHQHNRIRDERGRLVDLNAKYALQTVRNLSNGDGYVRLVDDPAIQQKLDGRIIATYLPFGLLASEEFARN